MKIDFVISSLRGGGAERVLTLLATHFSEVEKDDVRIVTINKGEEYEISDQLKRVKLDKGFIPNHSIRSFVNLGRFYAKKKNRPDVIVSFITLTNMLIIPIAKLYGIGIVATEHNSYLRVMPPIFLSKLTREYIYRFADYVTVLTSFDIDYYKGNKVPVTVMPNPCTFIPLEEVNTEREKVILAVGKLDRYNHKGFDNLIELIAPVLKNNPGWKLAIAGSGDTGLKLLKELTAKNNIEGQVDFLGFVTNVSEIMQRSSIFILSSRFEGLPMVLLEAMSQGMACIAYNCKTGPSDIIIPNESGLLIEDQNMSEMQENLQKLIADKDLRIKLGTNAIKGMDKFSIETIASMYKTLFKNILKK